MSTYIKKYTKQQQQKLIIDFGTSEKKKNMPNPKAVDNKKQWK